MVTLAAGLDWSIFFKPAFDGSGTYFRFLLVGFAWTVLLSVLAWILAFVVGSIIGVLRTFPGKFLPALGAVYVEIFRNVPLLVQLFLWYFVFPEIIPGLGTWFKQGLSPLLQQLITGVLCLGLFTAARVAEQLDGLVLVTGLRSLAELADRGLHRRLDGLVAQPGRFVGPDPLDL